jgi:TonB family protein
MPNAQNAQRAAASGGYRITAFPKEFERGLFESLDKRFYTILLTSLAVVYGIVIFLGNLEYSQAEVDAQIKKRYLQKFYETTIGEEEVAQVEEEGAGGIEEKEAPEEKEEKIDKRAKDEGKRVEAVGPSAAERRAMRRQAARQRGQQRRSMEQAVVGTGVLAELTAGGGGGSGQAIADVLGDGGGSVGNLDEVLGQVGGLQTASSSARRSRLGARSSGGSDKGAMGIDNLIDGSGVGASGSVSIRKKGGFAIKASEGNVSGEASKSSARSANAISRVLNKHLEAINNCYKKELRLNPNLKGSISVNFTIAPNGRVIQVKIKKSTLRSKKVESCVSRVIKRWRFQKIDKKEGNATFSNKFIFNG